MGWFVGESIHATATKPWVVKTRDGAIAGCHETREKALWHCAMLNASDDSHEELGLDDISEGPSGATQGSKPEGTPDEPYAKPSKEVPRHQEGPPPVLYTIAPTRVW